MVDGGDRGGVGDGSGGDAGKGLYVHMCRSQDARLHGYLHPYSSSTASFAEKAQATINQWMEAWTGTTFCVDHHYVDAAMVFGIVLSLRKERMK